MPSIRLRTHVASLGLALVLWSCLGPDAPAVTVRTDRDHCTYLDPVLVTIANATPDSVYQELCEGALEGYGY